MPTRNNAFSRGNSPGHQLLLFISQALIAQLLAHECIELWQRDQAAGKLKSAEEVAHEQHQVADQQRLENVSTDYRNRNMRVANQQR